MDIIEQFINDLRETWGYTTEELNDIRHYFELLYNVGVFEGKESMNSENINVFQPYGKKEDWE